MLRSATMIFLAFTAILWSNYLLLTDKLFQYYNTEGPLDEPTEEKTAIEKTGTYWINNNHDANTDDDKSIDVILTVYNRGSGNLRKQLEMIQRQTLHPTQIVVVQGDDLVKDVPETIRQFTEQYEHYSVPIRHIHFHYDKHAKYHNRFHVAYTMSKARYVSVWDDDLSVGFAWLETVVQFMASQNDQVLVGNNKPRVLFKVPDPYRKQTDLAYYDHPRYMQVTPKPLETNSSVEAYRVDWPIQQYNLRRDHIRHFLAAPVQTYETGEDIQLAHALQQQGILSYALIPKRHSLRDGHRDQAIRSLATEAMGAHQPHASYLKKDKRARQWLVCHLIYKLQFKSLACNNCNPSVLQRCLEYTTTPLKLQPSFAASIHQSPPIFVLTMPSRLDDMQETLAAYKNVFFVPANDKNKLTYNELVANRTIREKHFPPNQHVAKYPLTLGQIAVQLGHVRLLQEFKKYLASPKGKHHDYGIFLEDDVVLPPNFVQRTQKLVNATQSSAPINWEIINLGRCLALCEEDNNNNQLEQEFHFSNRLELCRSAYLVHRRGLDRLIQRSLPMENLPGDKMWFQDDQLVGKYSLVPRLVSQNRSGLGSLKSTVAGADQEYRLQGEEDLPVCPQINNSQAGWTFCGKENEQCDNCPVGSSVRFGCGDHWTPLRTEAPIIIGLKGRMSCSRKVFGDPLSSMPKICQCKPPAPVVLTAATKQLDAAIHPQRHSTLPQIVITTYYGGSTGQAYRDVTEVPLEMYAKRHGYRFEPYDSTTLQYAGITDQKETVEDHKFVKMDLLSHTMSQHKQEPNTWIWWTDSDVLMDAYGEHSMEDLIGRYGMSAEGRDCHIILLRRQAVTSSSILVKNSQQGNDFLQAWNDWRKRPNPQGRFKKFGWKDQAVLNDMLFEQDGMTVRHQWKWRKYVHQVDCLCTDLGKDCDDWFCEGIYPSKYKVSDFAIHAAGCDQELTTERCVEELRALATQRAVGRAPEPIYGITVTRRASEAARAARRFFRQSYEPKKMVIVTDSKDVVAFQSALRPWVHDVNLVFLPANTTLGALRQAGIEQVPMNSIYVQWDDDDIRAPSLLLYQYSEMVRNTGISAVTLNSQIRLGLSRNVSTVGTKPSGKRREHWHGIAGTIMGRRLPTTPTYNSTLHRAEDSQFLMELLDQDEKQVHVYNNPPQQYIRIYGRSDHASVVNASAFSRLSKMTANKWEVPTQLYGSVNEAQRISHHPLRELSHGEFIENKRVVGSSPSWCVVLTATLSPHTDVDRLMQSSVEDRAQSYRRSLGYWNTQTDFPNVWMVENSNIRTADDDPTAPTLFQTLQQEFPSIHMLHAPLENSSGNKGMGEKQSVFDALQADPSIGTAEQCTNVLKITGRFLPPVGLKEALDRCSPSSQLIVQRHSSSNYQPMESQLFGWPRGGVVEELYQRWNGEETDIERYLYEIVKFVGQCDGNTDEKTKNFQGITWLAEKANCRDVCFVGPLDLPEPVIRGGSGTTVDVI